MMKVSILGLHIHAHKYSHLVANPPTGMFERFQASKENPEETQRACNTPHRQLLELKPGATAHRATLLYTVLYIFCILARHLRTFSYLF